MPLQAAKESPSALAASLQASAAASSKPSFLIIYASLTGGRSWCGDCRAAEPFVNKKFGVTEDVAKVVYAGQPAEWRRADNPWRQEPFLVTNLPTIVKVTPDGVWEKLVEADVYDQKKLDVFVGKKEAPTF